MDPQLRRFSMRHPSRMYSTNRQPYTAVHEYLESDGWHKIELFAVVHHVISRQFDSINVKKPEHNMYLLFLGLSHIKWGASFRWSFLLNTAWGNIETMTIGKKHPLYKNLNNAEFSCDNPFPCPSASGTCPKAESTGDWQCFINWTNFSTLIGWSTPDGQNNQIK